MGLPRDAKGRQGSKGNPPLAEPGLACRSLPVTCKPSRFPKPNGEAVGTSCTKYSGQLQTSQAAHQLFPLKLGKSGTVHAHCVSEGLALQSFHLLGRRECSKWAPCQVPKAKPNRIPQRGGPNYLLQACFWKSIHWWGSHRWRMWNGHRLCNQPNLRNQTGAHPSVVLFGACLRFFLVR